ncbi:MAG: hypothetical protein KDB03_09030 [Planctomycetales bacterium]|nr:hypothetical protein [Planctomycetales bacterium]
MLAHSSDALRRSPEMLASQVAGVSPQIPLAEENLPKWMGNTLVNQLADEIQKLETGGQRAKCTRVTSAGCQALDACLPAGGYAPGQFVEYVRLTPACGATYLAFLAAASAIQGSGGYVVVVDPQQQFYPPAMLGLGIPLEKLIMVRPENQADMLWAIDQALRTRAVAAVVADVVSLDDKSARRIQLAAERGGSLALLLRNSSARRGQTWADFQWLVRSVSLKHSITPNLQPAASLATCSPSTRVSTDVGHTSKFEEAFDLEKPGLGTWAKQFNRRIDLQLTRARGGRAGHHLLLDIQVHSGQLRLVTDETTVQRRLPARVKMRVERRERA